MSTDPEDRDSEITKGDTKKTTVIPESLEHAAKRVSHADIESSEIAEKILENTETE